MILGGTGQIGRATGRALRADGWTIIAAQRRVPPRTERSQGIRYVALDRTEPGALARAVGGGVDALIDTIAYGEGEARQLLGLEADVGTLVVVSSASVYTDAKGRTLDEAAKNGFPHLPEPINEDQPTVGPGPSTYSTRKVALEQSLLQDARRPVTILRPAAIHGPGSLHPREWFFVKRALDGRRVVPLAYRGQSRFHTSATVNIAELIRAVLADPATQVLNTADPEALSVTAIGEAIGRAMDHQWRMAPMSGPPNGGVGGSPWTIPRPIVLDMSRAAAVGYRPVVGYEQAVGAACRSAEALAADGAVFPDYILKLFDYAAEDRWLGGV